jgi:hypothetical protein
LIIDFLLAESDFLKNVINRAVGVDFLNSKIKTITPEDLVLLKLLANRKQDLADIEKIFSSQENKLDHSYLNKWSKVLNVKIDLM